MRICYVLLSPTFGMHQYTADLASYMARAGHDVHLVTTARFPRDRYHPAVVAHTPALTTDTGLSLQIARLDTLHRARRTICELCPDVVHITGPHVWNVPLLAALRRAGIATVHTLHDLDPHSGTRYGRLLYAWNRLVLRLADHVLVHGACYGQRLLAMGLPAHRVTYTPLLFLFVGHGRLREGQPLPQGVRYEDWALFFGRLERYKGLDVLMRAQLALSKGTPAPGGPDLVIAGNGALRRVWDQPLPPGVEVRNRLIGDEEALDLFSRCGLVVLPYLDATQSALIAAAYYFYKPVVASRTGALAEYVQEGRTGWLVQPGDAEGLAACLAESLSDTERLARMGQAGRAWYDAQRAQEGPTLSSMYERLALRTSPRGTTPGRQPGAGRNAKARIGHKPKASTAPTDARHLTGG